MARCCGESPGLEGSAAGLGRGESGGHRHFLAQCWAHGLRAQAQGARCSPLPQLNGSHWVPNFSCSQGKHWLGSHLLYFTWKNTNAWLVHPKPPLVS